jgi:drug/metabolite transporter (DMT)-like permease
MISLLLGILSSAMLFIAFRSFKSLNINTLQAVVVNYYVCVITGWFAFGKSSQLSLISLNNPWFIYALVLGTAFILVFYLIAMTTQIVSVTAGSLATKISLVIPVMASLLIFNTQQKEFNWINYSGILLSLVAIVLSTLKKEKKGAEIQSGGVRNFLLTLAVFVCSGAIDTSLNYLNLHYIKPEASAFFLVILFGMAGVAGTVVAAYRLAAGKDRFSGRNIIGGIYLGIPNFFSVYFMLDALSAFGNDGAFLFPVFNIGIIVCSSVAAVIIFKEQLSRLNQLGLLLAVLAILFIAYQEIFQYLKLV